MGSVLRIALVDPKDASRDALKSSLLGLDTVWLEAECSRYEFFIDVVAQTHPDICFVALHTVTSARPEAGEYAALCRPWIPAFAGMMRKGAGTRTEPSGRLCHP